MTDHAFHPEALNDLDEIWEFIARDNVDAADRVVAQVLATCENLSRLPHQGHHRPELSSRSLRFAVVRDYLLAYAPDERPLWVVAICMANAIPASWRQFCAIEGRPRKIRRREWPSGGRFREGYFTVPGGIGECIGDLALAVVDRVSASVRFIEISEQ